ncbi:MAG: hypothetical protein Rubg2KO_07610 [Rubricoccaceae bacterium]
MDHVLTRRTLVAVVCLLTTSACAQSTSKPAATSDPYERRADSVIVSESDTTTLPQLQYIPAPPVTELVASLGDAMVRIRVHELDGPMRAVFSALNMHDDESTSVDAALDVMRERGGRVVELVHTGDRNVTFRVDNTDFVADPNRMFTDVGRRRTLADKSRDTPEARAALAAFAESVLAAYAPGSPAVITLHNNTEDNYTASSYAPGGIYETDAAAVTVHPGSDPDDFFFVTDQGLYDALVARGFNAVLQDNDAATDDGSLSVWAAQEGVPYVNVEAQHGHQREQARMIDALMDALAEL